VFIESMDGINEETPNVKTTVSCNSSNVDSVDQQCENDLSQIDDVHLQVINFQVVQWRTHTTRPFFALNDHLHFDLIKPQLQQCVTHITF
jgi:hypothetical protein